MEEASGSCRVSLERPPVLAGNSDCPKADESFEQCAWTACASMNPRDGWVQVEPNCTCRDRRAGVSGWNSEPTGERYSPSQRPSILPVTVGFTRCRCPLTPGFNQIHPRNRMFGFREECGERFVKVPAGHEDRPGVQVFCALSGGVGAGRPCARARSEVTSRVRCMVRMHCACERSWL